MRAAEVASSGPRAAGKREIYAQLMDEIEQGARLHYASASDAGDRDLELLLGDQSYATGLSRLAELGDIEATSQLADAISLVAQAQAAGDRELAAAVWEAGAVAVGWGTSAAIEQGKSLAREGASEAASALRQAAAERRSSEHHG